MFQKLRKKCKTLQLSANFRSNSVQPVMFQPRKSQFDALPRLLRSFHSHRAETCVNAGARFMLPIRSTNHYLFAFDLCNNIKHNIMQNAHQSVPVRQSGAREKRGRMEWSESEKFSS
jgi:hypothetical protein